MTRWTDENKAILLRLIFETQSFTIDPDKIVDAWPTENDKPTAKALSEQLGKYRKSGSSISFSYTKKGKRGVSDEPGTPSPRKARKKNPKKAIEEVLSPVNVGNGAGLDEEHA
ncbi:uncharacterized protein BO80DRAFT_472381 [Aspergillus ibericus CBS 121593]|uniref:Uncharacterized protein n=1 Tax=Aspergillus ibericus CBS 121593 TaxID=1448316 RepID=A0A395H3B1_9EURO|nr:hypothetical protein BO80DRAFT_472381 [Aspergillus ibericus CBS 121593]RAL02381.1 hypothetical protein BO80DRAFT_472381 [Aspergillus ibericus CBS 121593]